MILMEVMGYAIEGRWVVKAEGGDVVEGYYVSGTALGSLTLLGADNLKISKQFEQHHSKHLGSSDVSYIYMVPERLVLIKPLIEQGKF